ncbi:MAG TPA: type II toxin-antitoxin system HipA family toxin [Nocardioidaceae bacterium]|nr:type II toxin-antitoxin system HipA family toxin [Nocardioidaceae bacterium]
MADERLFVVHEREVVATLSRRRGGRLVLQYDSAYAARPDATPLSISLPLSVAPHGDAKLRPWLWGLLPDTDAVLTRWARDFGVSGSNPYSLLSTPVGEDCAGAFSFVPADRLDAVLAGEGDVEWLTDARVAAALRELRVDQTSWLGTRPPGRFSLAGVQAKTALLWDGTRWGRPSGAVATSHVLKPAIAGLDDHDLNEHLCLRAAREVGLPVVDSAVRTFEDQSVIVVRRYDRVEREGRQVRVHQEDLCQAFGLPPNLKYQADGGPSPRQIADLLRRALPGRIAERSVRDFADALVWNWIIAGTDAHAKNYSLLLSGDNVRLAPFYDIASALPYDDMPIQRLRLAMKFGRHYELRTTPSTWRQLAHDLGLPEGEVRARAGGLVERAPEAFATAVHAGDVSGLDSPLPSRLADAVAVRAKDCGRSL